MLHVNCISIKQKKINNKKEFSEKYIDNGKSARYVDNHSLVTLICTVGLTDIVLSPYLSASYVLGSQTRCEFWFCHLVAFKLNWVTQHLQAQNRIINNKKYLYLIVLLLKLCEVMSVKRLAWFLAHDKCLINIHSLLLSLIMTSARKVEQL